MKMYVVRDATIGRFFTKIHILHGDAHAKRLMQHACLGGDPNMTENPDDYTLYRVGAFSDEAGIPVGHDPERVCTGMEAVEQGLKDREKLAELKQQIEKLQEVGTEDAN